MSRRRVLVVDDEATICDAVAARLRAEGFDVVTAPDGPSAVAECGASSPDVLVLDVIARRSCWPRIPSARVSG